MTEQEILKTMKALDVSRAEAIGILKEDEEIDRMEMSQVDNDLTAEQKKVKKQMTKTGDKKKPTVYKFDKPKERKVDETKKRFLTAIKVLLEGAGCAVETPKTEAEMHFTYEDESYTLKLIKHRAPKDSK